MQDKKTELIDIGELRIGMYVELDIDWMAHPFLKGSFKISTDKQLEAVRALGLSQVRYVADRSEVHPDRLLNVTPSVLPRLNPQELQAVEQARAEVLRQRQLRSERMAAQQRSLLACEKRFAEAVRLYRQASERVMVSPKASAEQCAELIRSFVSDLSEDGDAAIRLLSECPGDRISMHPVNVTILALLLARAMGLPKYEMQDLGMASLLHDIGKLELPDRVRWYEENFSSTEYKLYQQHVSESLQLARKMELSPMAQLAIAQHHELVDGNGYPSRVRGDSMPLSSKILALVNRYDDLCNPGWPGTAMTPHEALSFIFAQNKNRYDGVVLSAFIRMMGVYPPGSVIELLDGRYALVVSVNSSRPLKPRVMVHDPEVPRHEAQILDLERAPEIGIRRSVKPASLSSDAVDYLMPRQRICYFYEQVAAQDEMAAA